MIRIAVVGEIGSGKTYIARLFGLPVFNADNEVADIYKKDKKVEMFAVCNKEIKIIISIYDLKDKLKWIQGWKDILD